MPWLELRIDVSEKQISGLEDALSDAGALAITYTDAGDQPILEPEVGTMPLWSDIVLVALFDSATDTTVAEKAIFSDSEKPNERFRWEILEDRVWEREWLKHQQPAKFGEAFWVYHKKIEDELPTLLLDPGLAFGTGSHPTTALCLEWIAHQDLLGKTVIDYGCGSGILAIAALLGGASSAACIDIDAQALEATQNNAKRNQIPGEKIAVFFPGSEPEEQSPILLANILAGPLKEFAPTLANKVSLGGSICLSGILREQELDIVEAYQRWFDNLEATYLNDWVRVTGIRNGRAATSEAEI